MIGVSNLRPAGSQYDTSRMNNILRLSVPKSPKFILLIEIRFFGIEYKMYLKYSFENTVEYNM